MDFYQKHSSAILEEFSTTENGLSEKEAGRRLAHYGPNVIEVVRKPLWRIIIEPFANMFMVVLIVAAVFSILHGAALDAVIIGVIMAISAAIYYVQYFSTEKILRDLRDQSIEQAKVLRGGKQRAISATDLVMGDIIVVNEGQKIPADARVLSAEGVRVDESLLTGESEPVSKQPQPLKGQKPAYEQSNILFQGSFVVSGEATAAVVRTGNQTEFGRIAALSTRTDIESPVQKKIDALLTQIIIMVVIVSIIVFILSMQRGIEVGEAIRFILTLAVSAVPEGLPVAITVILVLGMRRLAKQKALIRNMAAIETLGVVTTVATDKTGTLTKNILTVQKTWQLPHANDALNEILPYTVNQTKGRLHDPLDIAFAVHAKSTKRSVPDTHALVASLPFDHRFAMSGNLWQHGTTFSAYIKGAPEHILGKTSLNKTETQQVLAALEELTGEGNRVIAFAKLQRATRHTTLETLPDKLIFIGLVAVADVLRPEAKPAVLAAKEAGIQVQMITGDHVETAYRIAQQLGIATHRNEVFDSRKLNELSDKELVQLVGKINVFARVVPEQKYRILSALKAHGVPAMTGDGVNDVPALANANVGIAMGSGSQIAKDAGDMVLLDNNFKSIVSALKEGRVIFSNIRRMLFYLLTTTTGEILTMIGALLIGLPLPVAPVQILWINLVTDTALVIPLGLEPGEKHIMKQRPRRPGAPLLNRYLVSRLLLTAATMAVVALIIFQLFMQSHGVAAAQTFTFTALVVMQWANALNARRELQSIFGRGEASNKKFYIGLGIAASLQLLALFGPLQPVLHVVQVPPLMLFVTSLVAASAVIAVSELHKYFGRHHLKLHG
ncbi:MAG TPA: cation-transporting P-type ATPase [Verrucomicrobiae bacterium]|nr:cation-transporting P-type ATPase [Verrucomicrobiae bacterium]